jgi:hypothetical protein
MITIRSSSAPIGLWPLLIDLIYNNSALLHLVIGINVTSAPEEKLSNRPHGFAASGRKSHVHAGAKTIRIS